jgi:predicted NBD/HSP70 family sugar kinase
MVSSTTMVSSNRTASAPPATGAVAVLRAIHGQPGIARAAVGRDLGMTSGFVAETVARLARLQLLTERPAPRTGERGRPTTTLHPHPEGPLVAAAAIGHETWRVAVAELGGGELTRVERSHTRDPGEVLQAVATALGSARRSHGQRIRAVAVAVPGTTSGVHLAQAAGLGWRDVDLSVLWPRTPADQPLLVGNDASFAAVAEAHRGAGASYGCVLHLFLDSGVGGAFVENGHPSLGATGTAGEFGHMPFGTPGRRCPCGATGCWNTSLDGAALARALDHPEPPDAVTYTHDILAAARATPAPSPELAAVEQIARSLGAGAAGLVNALDPHVVTLGALGRDLLEVSGDVLNQAYLDGLMQFRRAAPPPILAATFGADAPLIGAIDEAFATVLTDQALQAWSARDQAVPDQHPR